MKGKRKMSEISPKENQESSELKNEPLNAESMLVQFCIATTAHGFSYLTRTLLLGKIFWFVF